MTIHVNPNRINISTGPRTGAGQRRQTTIADAEVIVPKRAHVNHIPAPESLRTLISGAVEALRRGVYWDRGTILNLLV